MSGTISLAVAYPIFNRTEMVAATAPAIMRMRGVSDVPILVGADGHLDNPPEHLYRSGDVSKTRDVVRAAFCDHQMEVSWFVHKTNAGMSDNIVSTINRAFLVFGVDAVVVLEDDVLVSRDFLVLMRILLARYRDNPHVLAVTGNCEWCGSMHANRDCVGLDFSAKAAVLKPSAWWITIGWAVWRDRWQTVYQEYKDFRHDPKAWAHRKHERISSVYPARALRQILRPLLLMEHDHQSQTDGAIEMAWGAVVNIARCAQQQVIIEPRAARSKHIGWYGRNMNAQLAAKVKSTEQFPWRSSVCWKEDWETEKLILQLPSDEEVKQHALFQGLA